MPELTNHELLQMIEQIRMQLNLIEKAIKERKAAKEWLTTSEFAEKHGNLTSKTVSTYCSTGRFSDDNIRRNPKGYWEIHKSELPENN